MKKYLIYDGRAASGDTDEAVVHEVCDSLKEAKRAAPSYGDGCAIYSYDVDDSHLVNEQFECVVQP